MPQFLLIMYQPGGPPPPPEVLGPIMRDLAAVNAEMRDAGAWVSAARLHPPGEGSVLRLKSGRVVITDGPFAESKEQMGGFTIIEAADHQAALAWAAKMAQAVTLPIEVRRLQ